MISLIAIGFQLLQQFHQALRRIFRIKIRGIRLVKVHFCPLLWTNQKRESNEASQTELQTIELFAQFSCWQTANGALKLEVVE